MPAGRRDWLPYRGDDLPRRSSDKYVLREKSLSKRIFAVLIFAVTGLGIGYLIGGIFNWERGTTIFACSFLLVLSIIIYFAKEDVEKIDIHDQDEISDKSDDD